MTSGTREEVMFVTTFASRIKVPIGAMTKKYKERSQLKFSFFILWFHSAVQY